MDNKPEFVLKADGIYQLKVPFMTVYTSVFLVVDGEKKILVDSATTEYDVDEIILPALKQLGCSLSEIDTLVLTHGHSDHAGGADRIRALAPRIGIVRGVEQISEHASTYSLPGHTRDFIGVLDLRTGTLISGDGLQGAGIGKYRCLVSDFEMYFRTLDAVGTDSRIENLLFSHAYEPWLSDTVIGRAAVLDCLDVCRTLAEKKKAGLAV